MSSMTLVKRAFKESYEDYAEVVARLKKRGLVTAPPVAVETGKIVKLPQIRHRNGATGKRVLAELRKDGPLEHTEIARRIGLRAHLVCTALANLKRRGAVVCIRKSGIGVGCRPGLWGAV